MLDTRTTITINQLSTQSLEEEYREARARALQAWEVQSRTTREEGYTDDQARAAIERARAADAAQHAAYERLEESLRLARWLARLAETDKAIQAAAHYIAMCGGYIAGPTQVHTGRGTYGFFGPGKFARAAEVKRYLDNNGVAYTVQPHRWNEVTISI